MSVRVRTRTPVTLPAGFAPFFFVTDPMGKSLLIGKSFTNNSDPDAVYTNDITLAQFDESGQAVWISSYENPDRTETARVASFDQNGNIYLAGFSDLTNGVRQGRIWKFDSGGVQVWRNLFIADVNYTQANGMAADANGNTAVIFNDFADTRNTLAKFDSNGVLAWQLELGASSGYSAVPFYKAVSRYHAVFDQAGNIVVTGPTRRSDTDETPVAVTIKFATDGMPLWTNRHDSGAAVLPDAIAMDRHDNVFVATFSGTYSSTPPTEQTSSQRRTIISYAPGGRPRWTNHLDRTEAQGYTLATDDPSPLFATDREGAIYIATARPLPSPDFPIEVQTAKFGNHGALRWLKRKQTAALFYGNMRFGVVTPRRVTVLLDLPDDGDQPSYEVWRRTELRYAQGL